MGFQQYIAFTIYHISYYIKSQMCVFMYLSITTNRVLANVILATCFGSKMEPKGRQEKVHKDLVARDR
jgi:hypothetical protein